MSLFFPIKPQKSPSPSANIYPNKPKIHAYEVTPPPNPHHHPHAAHRVLRSGKIHQLQIQTNRTTMTKDQKYKAEYKRLYDDATTIPKACDFLNFMDRNEKIIVVDELAQKHGWLVGGNDYKDNVIDGSIILFDPVSKLAIVPSVEDNIFKTVDINELGEEYLFPIEEEEEPRTIYIEKY